MLGNYERKKTVSKKIYLYCNMLLQECQMICDIKYSTKIILLLDKAPQAKPPLAARQMKYKNTLPPGGVVDSITIFIRWG